MSNRSGNGGMYRIKQPKRGRGNHNSNDNHIKKPQPQTTSIEPIKMVDLLCPLCHMVVRPFEVVDIFFKSGSRAPHESCVRNALFKAGLISGRTIPDTPSGLSSFLKRKVAEFAFLPTTKEVQSKISAILRIHQTVLGREIELSSIKKQLAQNYPSSLDSLDRINIVFEIFPKTSTSRMPTPG